MRRLTPMKAIRAKCIDCSGGNMAEVRKCEIDDCSLFIYRMGHRPDRGEKIQKTSRSPLPHMKMGHSIQQQGGETSKKSTAKAKGWSDGEAVSLPVGQNNET